MKVVVCLLLALALASLCEASTKSLCKKAKGSWTKETKLTRCEANINGCRGLGCYCRPITSSGPGEPRLATAEQLKAGAKCVTSNKAGWVHKQAETKTKKEKKKSTKAMKKLCKKAKGRWTKETKLTRCEANVNGCRGVGCYCRPMTDSGPAEPQLATGAQLEAGAKCVVRGDNVGWIEKKKEEEEKEEKEEQVEDDAKKLKKDAAELADENAGKQAEKAAKKAEKHAAKFEEKCTKLGGTFVDGACKCQTAFDTKGVIATWKAMKKHYNFCPRDASLIRTRRRAECVQGGGRYVVLRGDKRVSDIFYDDASLHYEGKDYHGNKQTYAVISHKKVRGLTHGCMCDPLSTKYVPDYDVGEGFRCPKNYASYSFAASKVFGQCKAAGGKVVSDKFAYKCRCKENVPFFKSASIHTAELRKGMKCSDRCITARQWKKSTNTELPDYLAGAGCKK